MRNLFLISAVMFSSWSLLPAQEVPTQPERSRIEVVFVLDTTGSMSGLIEGAKKKIWSIANTLALGKPTPDLHIGLVAYRDKGDAYVTQLVPLTNDLDAIYEKLLTFQADGGGDTPENVRQGLHDALTQITWSRERRVLKILFLVGDCPPHLDYTDVPSIEELCTAACKTEVIINTIRCGGDEETGRIWQEIARKSEGQYFSIDQGGGTVAITTPFDEELGVLSDKMGRTLCVWGDKDEQLKAAGYAASAESMESPSKADRAGMLGRSGRMSAGDLVDAVRQNQVILEEVKDEELPEEMQKMSMEERKAHLDRLFEERQAIQARIVELSKQRDAFIADEIKKRGAEDAFDQVVGETLKAQARKKGIRYGE